MLHIVSAAIFNWYIPFIKKVRLYSTRMGGSMYIYL